MIYDVIVSKENDDFIAGVKEWPDVVVKEHSREMAINNIKSKLLEYLSNDVELVQIDVPVGTKTANPWLEKFGWFKDDPTFDDLEAEIASYRKEIDTKMGHNTK